MATTKTLFLVFKTGIKNEHHSGTSWETVQLFLLWLLNGSCPQPCECHPVLLLTVERLPCSSVARITESRPVTGCTLSSSLQAPWATRVPTQETSSFLGRADTGKTQLPEFCHSLFCSFLFCVHFYFELLNVGIFRVFIAAVAC